MYIYTRQSTAYANDQESNVWRAFVSGPWYDDSEPEGCGATEEEAVQSVLEKMVSIRDEINELLDCSL